MKAPSVVPAEATTTLPSLSSIDPREVIEDLYANKSPRTVEAYARDLLTFAEYLEVDSVTAAARIFFSRSQGEAHRIAVGFKQFLVGQRKLKPNSVNRHLASVRSLAASARALGLIPYKLEIKGVKVKAYKDTQGPGPSHFRRMLDKALSRQDKKGLRDAAILRCLFDLSARRGELVRADLSDLDLESGTLEVLGKGRNEKETLTLAEATTKALKAWLNVRGTEPGPLFTSLDRAAKGDGRLTGRAVHQIVKRLGREIGIDTRPHGLRHSGITQAIKLVQRHQHEESDPEKRILFDEVLQYSRHKNIKTLMIYRDNDRNVQGRITRMVAESV